jgi:hypothetical protein
LVGPGSDFGIGPDTQTVQSLLESRADASDLPEVVSRARWRLSGGRCACPSGLECGDLSLELPYPGRALAELSHLNHGFVQLMARSLDGHTVARELIDARVARGQFLCESLLCLQPGLELGNSRVAFSEVGSDAVKLVPERRGSQ